MKVFVLNYYEDTQSGNFIRPFKAFTKKENAESFMKALGHINISLTELEVETHLKTKQVVDT